MGNVTTTNTTEKAHNMGQSTTGLKLIENELVPVYTTDTGEKVVYGSELHAVLEVKSKFADWVKNRINDCEAVENVEFQSFSKILEKGGRPQTEYIIKLDTAKEMAMLERNDKGKRVRRYFIEVEKKYKEEKPKSSAELLLMYAQQFYEQEQRISDVEQSVKELEAKVTTHNDSYFAIAGYASLRGVNIDVSKANMLGRKASRLSREYGYDISKIKDPRFGTVNTYHTDILKVVFDEEVA